METYFTKVKVQADRYIVGVGSADASPMKPTIIVASCLKHALGNEEMTEEEFNKRREGLLDGDCSCKG